MNITMFMTPSEIHKTIGMPEETVWDCIGNGSVGYSVFDDTFLVETSDIITLIQNRKIVNRIGTYDYEDGYYEQNAV